MFWAVAGPIIAGAVGALLSPKPNNSAAEAAARASDSANAIAARQLALSEEQWNYYKENYQPIEKSLIEEAKKAGTPEEYAAAEGRASADVTGAFDVANKNAQRRMQAYGINPASLAYESGITSAGLAEGAANAGARTMARNQQKNLAYSRMLDVAGIGRNIPAQSAASAAGAANSAGISAGAAGQYQNAINSQFLQNQTNMQNIGYAMQPIIGAARSYFTQPSNGNPSGYQGWRNTYDYNKSMSGDLDAGENPVGVKDGGLLTEKGVRKYVEGGNVTEDNDNILDMQKGSDGKFSAIGLEHSLMKKGFHPAMAKRASAAVITPHMKHKFAAGGGVGSCGLEGSNGVLPPAESNQILNGPGTETSDSIPANIDGQSPAALSKGEFVMSAEVPKLTGEEILQAINRAGLEKRESNPNTRANDLNLGMNAYAKGGYVRNGRWS